MEYACLFLGIFGLILILCSIWIEKSDDPRKLPFFTPIHSITYMTLCDAKKEAKVIAKYVRLIGIVVILICLIGFFF